ncbi:MAG: phosphomannomutase [Parcubacteria group bacterium Athens1014_26]|nr:MAG: phosphomannomutase [Parcubacteria group bacterium Athens1014_26]
MIDKIFKTYDIRGKYPKEINEAAVFDVAKALGRHFTSKNKAKKIVLGYDARLSSPSLYSSLIKGLRMSVPNSEIVLAGFMTTPMLYFLVNHFKASGGIMVTASHNPKDYNGLKVVGGKAVPLSGGEIYKIISNF